MKPWLFTGAAALLAAASLAPVARAEGPRASSANNWPGMTGSAINQLAAAPDAAVYPAPTAAPNPPRRITCGRRAMRTAAAGSATGS